MESKAKLARLHDLYYDTKSAGAYGGVDRLFRAAKPYGISRKLVQEFLRNETAYTLHKPVRRRYTRNKTIVHDVDIQWQADLVDMSALSSHNKGIHFILTVVDCFSRFAWAIPVYRKDQKIMTTAMKELIMRAAPRKPERLQTDRGVEFYNKPVQLYLKEQNIKHFSTHSDTKASIVERFNRTLKQRMWTYFTAHNTRKYLDILDDIVNAYNNSFHRSIGMRPIDVINNKENSSKVWLRQYKQYFARPAHKQRVLGQNEHVRVSKQKATFTKGYLPGWTEERFKVRRAKLYKGRRPVYDLEDFKGEPLAGVYYPEEVQVIKPLPEKELFQVEKILRRRQKKDTESELLVKWKGWPEKFNSWIKNSEYYKSKLARFARDE